MEFRILGPLEVVEQGDWVRLGGGKQRALLAVLLVHANEVVSADRLVEELWGEEPPATAAKIVQVYVSHLRRALGEGVLLTRRPGYVLRVEPGALDLQRFERLVAEARTSEPAAAGEKLRDALALWRGPPLADFAYEPFAQAEIARLEELRLAAVEARIDADLKLGRHAELVAELEALVSEHPLRERLRGQLMLALYRCGRQAEALEAYRRGRRLLADELGLEPSGELQGLEKAILVHDPSLHLPPAPARPVEPAERPALRTGLVFVGRQRELGELLAGLEAALAGQGRLFLIGGEPGIGKSRLADELANRARARGAWVLVGRCWEAGGAPAYWPWLQTIRAYARESNPEFLRAQIGAGAADVAQIVPELRELFPDLPRAALPETEGARFRLFDAVAQFLRNASKAQALVLVLDDLHAADEPSLLLLQFVARELGDSNLLVLAAYRDVDPTLSGPLTTTLTELLREPTTRLLHLVGLAEPDVARFIELTTARMPAAGLAAALHAETEGNPFFVGEIVQLLAAEGRLDDMRTEDARFSIPQSVRDVIQRRLRSLSEEATQVLTLASILGREFSLAALRRLGDLSEDEVFDLLDEAFEARLVTEVPATSGSVRFAHALIRDTLYEGLSATRRRRLHREAGEALEALYADSTEPHLTELAHHFAESATGESADKAAAYAQRAAEHSASMLAYEEASRLYESALQILDALGRPDRIKRCELLLALGDAQTLAGEGPEARETFLRAAELAKETQSRERFARAALGYFGRDLWGPRAEFDPNLLPLLEEALAGCGEGDGVLRAQLLARLASALRGAVDREQPASLARQAVEMAKRMGDRSMLLHAVDARLAATGGPENVAESVVDALDVVRLAEELGDQERAFGGHEHLLYAAWTLGDRFALARELEAMTRLAQDLRQPAYRWPLATHHAMAALSEGRLEAAEALIEEAFRVGERAKSWHAVTSYRVQAFLLRGQQGRVEDCEPILRSSLDEYQGYRIFECVLAHAYYQLGRDDEAREIFETIAGDDFRELSRDEDWLVNMCLLSEVCTYLGDTSRAATLYRLLSPFGALNAVAAGEIALGAVGQRLGRLAAELRCYEEAVAHFEVALEMNARMGAWLWLARTQHHYACILQARDGPGDAERAEILLGEATETYADLRMCGPLAQSAGSSDSG